jgi:hypothetical protein
MRNINNINFTLYQLKNIIDFVLTAELLFKSTVPQLIFYLDELERKGVFRIMNTSLDVLKKIGEPYTVEDMSRIGNGLVSLIGGLKKLTEPEAVAFLDKADCLRGNIDLSGARVVGAPYRHVFRHGQQRGQGRAGHSGGADLKGCRY